MPRKTQAKKTRKRRIFNTHKSSRAVKKSALTKGERILVSHEKAKPVNVLDLRKGLEEVLTVDDELGVLRPRELSWSDYYDTDSHGLQWIAADHGLPESMIGGVNFLSRISLGRRTNFLINLLAELPRDFVFFWKSKIKLIFKMAQWILEETGKTPFKIMFWILSVLEMGIVRPVLTLAQRTAKEIFYILRTGFLAIVYFPRNAFRFLRPAPLVNWTRSVAGFIIICLVIILPFGAYTHITKLKDTEGRVLGVTSQAYEYLQAAQLSARDLDFSQASEDFSRARENFLAAQKEIDSLNFLISGVMKVAPKGVAASRILEAGQAISEAGMYLTEGLGVLDDKVNGSAGLTTSRVDNLSTAATLAGVDLGVGGKIKKLQESFAAAYPLIILAKESLEAVEPGMLPAENQENFLEAKKKVLALETVCKKLNSFSKIINEVLGIGTRKRFLVVFENEQELRPTGGFLGSFALLDIKDGKIEQMEIPGGGPYDTAGSLIKRVAPPRPLQLVNDQWFMQDANWFSDFRESAKKIIWFYENADGATVDGVIAVTSGLIPLLLEITGPIEMPEYGKVIDKDNFYLETQLAVELEYDKEENRPKQFIADLCPKLLEKIIGLPQDKIINLLSVIDLGLSQKKLLFYFENEAVQNEAAANNWAGEVRKVGSGDDYLLIVNANIGGGKTDGVIEQKVIHETEVTRAGELIDTVTIIRTHNGGPGYVFANQTNKNYLRMYVPFGSVLLEAKGFTPLGPGHFRDLAPGLSDDFDLDRIEGNILVDEATGTRVTQEYGKTVFGNWLILEPGETVICKLRYRLPWTIDLGGETRGEEFYTLLAQKQPGTGEDLIEKLVYLPDGAMMTWKYPDTDFVGEGGGLVKFRSSFDMDKYYGVVFR